MEKKNRICFCLLFIVGTFLISTVSCKKNDTNTSPIPIVITADVTSVTYESAICGGTITFDGGFYISARGLCWSTGLSPTIADNKTINGIGNGIFTGTITGLVQNTTYYVRAYATSAAGTGYGNTIAFTTKLTGITVSDIDGNVYYSTTIGGMVWTKENLKTTRFKDGSSIPFINDNYSWSSATGPGYSYYDNDTSNRSIYGALYNWFAVNTGKLCPAGWHVPGDNEWQALIDSLGGDNVAGGKMKEVGTTHWHDPNISATNSSGFTALPGGYHAFDGAFYANSMDGFWWSATANGSTDAWQRGIDAGDATVLRSSDTQKGGASIRCVKD